VHIYSGDMKLRKEVKLRLLIWLLQSHTSHLHCNLYCRASMADMAAASPAWLQAAQRARRSVCCAVCCASPPLTYRGRLPARLSRLTRSLVYEAS
jgi:hypothetical protein